MSRIPILRIGFDKRMMSWEIPKFRAAVIESTSRSEDHFHNHGAGTTTIYRYPRIQYKIIDKRPHIICLEEGTDAIHALLKKKQYWFDVGRSEGIKEYKIAEANYAYHEITNGRLHTYSLLNYIPFNQEVYQKYKASSSKARKARLLTDQLHKHLTTFLKAVEYEDDGDIVLSDPIIYKEQFIQYKRQYHLAYRVSFTSSLDLPDYVGLGKGTSVGFGILRKTKKS